MIVVAIIVAILSAFVLAERMVTATTESAGVRGNDTEPGLADGARFRAVVSPALSGALRAGTSVSY